MAKKGYSLGSLADYVDTKFNSAGGEISGDTDVLGVLKEKGQRVYSPNNKPTAEDVGAVKKTGDMMTGTLMFDQQAGQFRGKAGGIVDLDTLNVETQGTWSYVYHIDKASPNLFPFMSNANAVLSFNTHQGSFNHQIGFSGDGSLYHRTGTASWGQVYTSNNPPPPSKVQAFPVGSCFICMSSGNPADILGYGTWRLIGGGAGATLCFGDGNPKDGTAYGNNHPGVPLVAHSHHRGDMEIRGRFSSRNDQNMITQSLSDPEGAFVIATDGVSVTRPGHYPNSGPGGRMDFAASRNWTGRTSVEGADSPTIDVTGVRIEVNVWERTA